MRGRSADSEGGTTTTIKLCDWESSKWPQQVHLRASPARGAGLSQRALMSRQTAPTVMYHLVKEPDEAKDEASDASDSKSDSAGHTEPTVPPSETLVRRDYACILCSSCIAPSADALAGHIQYMHSDIVDLEAFKDDSGRLHCIMRKHAATLQSPHKRRRRAQGGPPEDSASYYKAHRPPEPAVPYASLRFAAPLPLPPPPGRRWALGEDKAKGPHYLQRSGSFVPLRQYFHSRTCVPMLPAEMENDSDEELDDRWTVSESERLIDEFEDVSSEEKAFMKLWNAHMRTVRAVADGRMPQLTALFARRYAPSVVGKGLRFVFLMHLFNLWDLSLLRKELILECIADVDAYEAVASK